MASQNSEPIAPNRTEILDLLQSEIDSSRAESRRAGYTTWALAAAIASLSAIGLGKVTSVTVWKIAGASVACALLGDYLIAWARGWAADLERAAGKGRFYVGSDLANERPAYIWWLCRCAVMIGIAFAFPMEVPASAKAVLYTYYGLSILVFASLLWSTYKFSPFPRWTNTNGWGSIVGLGILAWLCWSSYAYARASADSIDEAIALARAAVPLVLASYLLYLVLKALRPDKHTTALVSLRRDVVLRAKSEASAAKQLDLLLTGLPSASYLERYAETINGMYDDIAHEVAATRCRLVEIAWALSYRLGLPTDDAVAVPEMKSQLKEIEKQLTAIKRLTNRAARNKKAFLTQFRTLRNDRPHEIGAEPAHSVIGDIWNNLNERETTSDSTAAECRYLIEVLRGTVAKRDGEALRNLMSTW